MKRKKMIILIIVIIVILAMIGIVLINKKENEFTNLEKTSKITVIPTMNDKITEDSSWCGTFQLVWNDMKNESAKDLCL